MISVYQLKSSFQKLLLPIVRFLNTKGVTANQLTISGILLSIFIACAFWYADQFHYLYLALPIGLFMRMAINAMDGMMARKFNQCSKKGEYLNEFGDVISDMIIFIPLLKFENGLFALVLVFILLSAINEFAGVLSKAVSGDRRYDGPMGKSDRALFVGLYGLLCFFQLTTPHISLALFFMVNILLLLSTYIRISKTNLS